MSEGRRKILIGIVLVLVLVFGIGQFFAFNQNASNNSAAQNGQGGSNGQQNSPNSGQPTTQVVVYEAQVAASSTPVEKGSCFVSSIAAPYRPDAWRCAVGNAISDPCFTLSSSTLACGVNPASTDISRQFVLQLVKPLPKPDVPAGKPPADWAWTVELADGGVCTPFTGTRPFSATGEAGTYSCSGGQAGETMIFGDLIASSTTWTAEVGSLSTATSTFPPPVVNSTTMPIFAVWQ